MSRLARPTPRLKRSAETPLGKIRPVFDGFLLADTSDWMDPPTPLPVSRTISAPTESPVIAQLPVVVDLSRSESGSESESESESATRSRSLSRSSLAEKSAGRDSPTVELNSRITPAPITQLQTSRRQEPNANSRAEESDTAISPTPEPTSSTTPAPIVLPPNARPNLAIDLGCSVQLLEDEMFLLEEPVLYGRGERVVPRADPIKTFKRPGSPVTEPRISKRLRTIDESVKSLAYTLPAPPSFHAERGRQSDAETTTTLRPGSLSMSVPGPGPSEHSAHRLQRQERTVIGLGPGGSISMRIERVSKKPPVPLFSDAPALTPALTPVPTPALTPTFSISSRPTTHRPLAEAPVPWFSSTPALKTKATASISSHPSIYRREEPPVPSSSDTSALTPTTSISSRPAIRRQEEAEPPVRLFSETPTLAASTVSLSHPTILRHEEPPVPISSRSTILPHEDPPVPTDSHPPLPKHSTPISSRPTVLRQEAPPIPLGSNNPVLAPTTSISSRPTTRRPLEEIRGQGTVHSRYPPQDSTLNVSVTKPLTVPHRSKVSAFASAALARLPPPGKGSTSAAVPIRVRDAERARDLAVKRALFDRLANSKPAEAPPKSTAPLRKAATLKTAQKPSTPPRKAAPILNAAQKRPSSPPRKSGLLMRTVPVRGHTPGKASRQRAEERARFDAALRDRADEKQRERLEVERIREEIEAEQDRLMRRETVVRAHPLPSMYQKRS